MRIKTFITILLTAMILIAAATLGVTTVYRVSAVTLEVSVVSEEAKSEAESLEARLSARYKKQNIFTVKNGEAKEEFADYPYFRLTGLKKSYPNRLIVTATEDAEVYAAEKSDLSGYYILGADGTLLCERKTPENRTDKKNNVILKGVSVFGDLGNVPEGEDFGTALAFCRSLDEPFGGIRSNVVSVSLRAPVSSSEYSVLQIEMREGVKVNVYNPSGDAKKKAEAFCSFYSGLSAAERLSGRIDVTDYALENGTYRVTYSS